MLEIDHIEAQGRLLDSLLTRASKLVAQRPHNERLFVLESEITFQQNQLIAGNMNFNVPAASDFRAQRFALYPFVRMVAGATAGENDRTFRPTFYTWQSPASQLLLQAVDASIELSIKSQSLQNAPFLSALTFSGNTNYVAGGPLVPNFSNYSRFECAGALVFDSELLLKAGEVLTVKVTPLFASPASSDYFADDRVFEYKLVGVLEGTKVIS